jgi:predicted transcriptional regulator of viral defense system
MRAVRTADGGAVYAHPGTQMARLERRGLLHKVAVGYYVVVSQEHVGTDWRPTIEAAAAGVATAAVQPGPAVLMGVSAAHMHNAISRALGAAIVAVPADRRDIQLRDRVGVVHFVQRDTELLAAELITTDLGQCLVTTAEQTVLDSAHRPTLGAAVHDAEEAIARLPGRRAGR